MHLPLLLADVDIGRLLFAVFVAPVLLVVLAGMFVFGTVTAFTNGKHLPHVPGLMGTHVALLCGLGLTVFTFVFGVQGWEEDLLTLTLLPAGASVGLAIACRRKRERAGRHRPTASP